jgi:uncharacterized iron-regulated membrane protein
MPFKGEVEPPSRIERIRCGVQSRTADAAQAVAERARPIAGEAAQAAQAAAQTAAASVSDAATTAARSVADAAATAAQSVAERARPLASEAASRGSAAWMIVRHGTPPSAMSRVTALLPTTAVTKAGSTMRSKGNSAVALMAIGGVAAAGVMWWRRSRIGTDSVWILDEDDSDIEPPDGWHEGSAATPSSTRSTDRTAGLADSEPSRKQSNTWP